MNVFYPVLEYMCSCAGVKTKEEKENVKVKLLDFIEHINTDDSIWIPSTRVSWDQYFMNVAKVVATRSTCLRRKVGSIAVINKRILATGYNGSPSGFKNCSDINYCIRDAQNVPSGTHIEKCMAIHAEQNLITQCAKFGESLLDSTVYVTCCPCSVCLKLLVQSGCKTVIYDGPYPDEMTASLVRDYNINVVDIKELG